MNALALVIGSAAYREKPLTNAVNDANDFASKLRNLNFIVKELTDCEGLAFINKVEEFEKELPNYDVGLFYFAGHAIQIDGENYLASIDTPFSEENTTKYYSCPLSRVIDAMQNEKTSIKILILDACRDNPFCNRGIANNGLAPVYAPKGTIIAFSTSPGEKAKDSGAETGRNSIYTGALLKHIEDPEIPIEAFFKRVRTTVFTLSKGKQTSWEHTSLIGNFYFNPKQFVQVTNSPYCHECIADENLHASGCEVDEIIMDLKSHNWPMQNRAVKSLESISYKCITSDFLFLLGRNLLQTAEGGEFFTVEIFKSRLSKWLSRYMFHDGINDVLNGILFEIYFNARGAFRETNFKSKYIDEIFQLAESGEFEKSFRFISEQLSPFREFLLYIPSKAQAKVAIEVNLDEISDGQDSPSLKKDFHLRSIKHDNFELLDLQVMDRERDDDRGVSLDTFEKQVCRSLCIPSYKLSLTLNVSRNSIGYVRIPWNLLFVKQKQ